MIVFRFFSLIAVLVKVGWMAFYLDRAPLVSSYGFPVGSDGVVRLVRERLIRFTCVYAAGTLPPSPAKQRKGERR